jgi:hypothetical protein
LHVCDIVVVTIVLVDCPGIVVVGGKLAFIISTIFSWFFLAKAIA